MTKASPTKPLPPLFERLKLPDNGWRIGEHVYSIALIGAESAKSIATETVVSTTRNRTRAATVFRDTLSEGFSHFVTSMTAPVASGWSVRRVGFAPTGKRRLVTAHG